MITFDAVVPDRVDGFEPMVFVRCVRCFAGCAVVEVGADVACIPGAKDILPLLVSVSCSGWISQAKAQLFS